MSQQGGQQDESGSLDFLWATVAVVAIALLIWYFAKDIIIKYLFIYKIWQLDLASIFTTHALALIPYLQSYQQNPADLNFPTFQLLMTESGRFVRYPFALFFLGLASYLFFTNSTSRFRKIFNMEGLYAAERNDWPHITPISQVDLIKEPLDTGPWAMALSPMEFAKKYGLIREIKENIQGTSIRERGTRIKVEVNRQKAGAVFASQIGREWEGPQSLPIHTRALFAAFLAKGNQDRTGSQALLDQISASSSTGKLNFAGTDALIEKNKNAKGLSVILRNHAYVNTVMASMLEFARQDGVLAASNFLWLKPVDRNLWFLLNSVGRQTPFAEVAGPYAHWLTEKDLRHRVTTPMVEEAINGLEAAIKDILFTKEEEG